MLFSISTVRLPFLHHLTPMSTSSVHIFCSELVQTLPLQIGSSNLSSNFLETFNYWFELKTTPTEHTERWTLPRVLYLSSVVSGKQRQFSWPYCFFFPPLPTEVYLLSLSLAFLLFCCRDHCPEGFTKGHSLEGSFTSACHTSPQLQHILQYNPVHRCG